MIYTHTGQNLLDILEWESYISLEVLDKLRSILKELSNIPTNSSE